NPRGMQSAIVATVFACISFFFVALRTYTRAVIVRNMGGEDFIIIAAWICCLAMCILICLEAKFGNGRHIETVSPENLRNTLFALYISVPVYQFGLVLVKISILWQYYRIFPGKNIRMACNILLVISVLYGFYCTLNNIFLCTPIKSYWTLSIAGKCLSRPAVWYSNAAINIATDIAIFVLPMPALYHLHLPMKQKLALMAIFALGAFVVLVSILRLPELHMLVASHDPLYDGAAIAYWSNVELCVGVICASLPTLRAFAARYFPK
ncbi:hypothetical protein BDZ85DRAFT_185945, partial [Elsinoe ampelina]